MKSKKKLKNISHPKLRYAIALALTTVASLANAADVYVNAAAANAEPVGSQNILDFALPLALTKTDAANNGLTETQRRAEMILVTSAGTPVAFNSGDNSLQNLASLPGSTDYFLYKYLAANTTLNGNTTLGTTGVPGALPAIIDLGEHSLTVLGGTLENQGAIFISTVNSLASRNGLLMNGTGALTVDSTSTGRVIANEIIEQTSGNPANFKVLLKLNSTLQNGTSFVFANETAGDASRLFAYSVTDAENSRLFDNSYVIDSSAARMISGANESVVVTFSRANNAYIEKSFTRNHPSNDAALKLGTIAAQGLALGDMQTALTRLDINDFGYGNNAKNLAVQVKRLAPIANNSLMIAATDVLDMVGQAADYRFAARRGNWTGQNDEKATVWAKVHAGFTASSGSVPTASADAQDTAGHDGFKTFATGLTVGADRRFENGLLGASLSAFATTIDQQDDRSGERAKQDQRIASLYGQLNGRNAFVALSYAFGTGTTKGERKTAIDRVADFRAPLDTTELALKTGYRFDLSDGRSAITPFFRTTRSQYKQSAYQETGAGALSLNVHDYEIAKSSYELGAEASYKGRFFGKRTLTAFRVSAGKERILDDLIVHANYTGETDTAHPEATNFTTPVERWADQFVKLNGVLQVELVDGMLMRLGLDFSARNSRQSLAADLGLIWYFD